MAVASPGGRDMSSYLRLSVGTGILCVLAFAQPALVWGQDKTVDQRVYAGKELDKARERLQQHKFSDNDIRKAFYDKDVDAVLLQVARSGSEIREIRISWARDKKGRLMPLKTLTNVKDPDFMALVKILEL
jgi:hypothetical protein